LSDSDDERISDESGHQFVRHEENERHEEPLQEDEAVRPVSPAASYRSREPEKIWMLDQDGITRFETDANQIVFVLQM
jgi:hypothetical protein